MYYKLTVIIDDFNLSGTIPYDARRQADNLDGETLVSFKDVVVQNSHAPQRCYGCTGRYGEERIVIKEFNVFTNCKERERENESTEYSA